jgi:hypothetical protein
MTPVEVYLLRPKASNIARWQAAGAGVRSVGPVRASLEEVFAELTAKAAGSDEK